ncbi:hypothetical protein [Acerihabitans arboris]|uniref:Uncharacterized protein n=1 Tax=Acerihabitans arboris TaxID=2691583 RepID=A0A845SI07_9GAMM|nr:hypothetical protein [Acerihabitans arboris]NDL62676.1 hypothetical protein [Acerihabitans arboris]
MVDSAASRFVTEQTSPEISRLYDIAAEKNILGEKFNLSENLTLISMRRGLFNLNHRVFTVFLCHGNFT